LKPEQLISPTLHTAAIAGLETAINAALQLDPGSQQRLLKLAGHSFHLCCSQPELDLYFFPGDTVRLCGLYDGPVTTTLTGTAQEFLKLATAEDPANALINGDLELQGDSSALIELQKIGAQLDLDWEQPLVDFFGDVLGHSLSEGLRSAQQFGLQLFHNLKRQVDDYLFEEANITAADWQGEQFNRGVDELKQRTERLEAKLSRLQQRVAAATDKHQKD
jgi:ubiquinone biosynthesis protein UbiJ